MAVRGSWSREARDGRRWTGITERRSPSIDMGVLVVAVAVMATFVAEVPAYAGPSLRRGMGKKIDKSRRRELAKQEQGLYAHKEKATLTGNAPPPKQKLAIWFRRPASRYYWEAVPIGNGSIGGMVYGGVHTERIQFNEHSLWTGSDLDDDIGDYQPFGDLYVELGHLSAERYRRELDFANAVARVEYTSAGTTFRRETFCSYPDKVMVVRFTADAPGKLDARVRMTDARQSRAVAAGNRITITGSLSNGMEYEAQVLALNEGGRVSAEQDAVRVQGADALTLLLSAGTSFIPDHSQRWLGAHPHRAVTEHVDKAASRTYSELKAAHLDDYRSLFERVSLDLGRSGADAVRLPTAERVRRFRQSPDDPELEQMVFQFGRYLLIGCSRPGTPAANLQGMWNYSRYPPWHCDYHSDLNLEMNYWPAEPAALTECTLPLLDYLESIVPVRRDIYQKEHPGKRGWGIRGGNNIFGGGSSKNYDSCNTWLAQHFWEHYAFTQDLDYLRTRAYPVLKELCEFWEDRLVTWPDGTLVSPSGHSPEHGCPTKDPEGKSRQGASFDQQLIWDLFCNYIDASLVLDIDEEYREKIAAMREKLLGPQIGSWGQLQEWSIDADKPEDKHRHISHFIAVYSGKQISPLTTPRLARAARVSLNARGDLSTTWGMVHRAAAWARLHDGERACRVLRLALEKGRFHENLLSSISGGCFQIDANFGYSAAVAEMLLQSQLRDPASRDYVIHLLPALPAAWSTGSFKGLRARGGFAVDAVWREGKLTGAVVRSIAGTSCVVRYGDRQVPVAMRRGTSVSLDASLGRR